MISLIGREFESCAQKPFFILLSKFVKIFAYPYFYAGNTMALFFFHKNFLKICKNLKKSLPAVLCIKLLLGKHFHQFWTMQKDLAPSGIEPESSKSKSVMLSTRLCFWRFFEPLRETDFICTRV
jgi:hypothetical protein